MAIQPSSMFPPPLPLPAYEDPLREPRIVQHSFPNGIEWRAPRHSHQSIRMKSNLVQIFPCPKDVFRRSIFQNSSLPFPDEARALRPLQNSSFNLSISNTFLYLYGKKQKISSPSFADIFLGQRNVKQTFFSQINTVIDWAPIRAIIEVAYTKGYNSTGRPGYDSLVLFKIELLRT